MESFHKSLFVKIGRDIQTYGCFWKKIKQVEHAKAVQLQRVQNGFQLIEVRRIQKRVADQKNWTTAAALPLDKDVDKFLRNVCHQSAHVVQTFATVPGNL